MRPSFLYSRVNVMLPSCGLYQHNISSSDAIVTRQKLAAEQNCAVWCIQERKWAAKQRVHVTSVIYLRICIFFDKLQIVVVSFHVEHVIKACNTMTLCVLHFRSQQLRPSVVLYRGHSIGGAGQAHPLPFVVLKGLQLTHVATQHTSDLPTSHVTIRYNTTLN